jgi:hypothetical protein
VGPVGRVDVDQDGADLGGGVLHEHPLGDVGRPDADPVTLADPRREQPGGQGVHLLAQLRVGEAPAGGDLDERLAVRAAGRGAVEVVADGVAEQRDVGHARGVRRKGR